MSSPGWRGRKVLHEEKWFRIYEAESGVPVKVSKFLTDEIAPSAHEIPKQWESWNFQDRISFAHAFSQKPHFSQEDEQILDFLMSVDDEKVQSTIALGLTRHSQRRRVLQFLIDRLQSPNSESKANYAYALGALGAGEAGPPLRVLHDRLSRKIDLAGATADRALIFDFVVCCSSLSKLEASREYLDQIRPFLDHPDKSVRGFSKVYLEGGPPSHRPGEA